MFCSLLSYCQVSGKFLFSAETSCQTCVRVFWTFTCTVPGPFPVKVKRWDTWSRWISAQGINCFYARNLIDNCLEVWKIKSFLHNFFSNIYCQVASVHRPFLCQTQLHISFSSLYVFLNPVHVFGSQADENGQRLKWIWQIFFFISSI